MSLTARSYSGDEALAMGLVNWRVPNDRFDAEIESFCAGILANSWLSLRAQKRLQRETDGLAPRAGLSHEIHRSEGRGPDMDMRISAFMNKARKAG